MSIKVIFQWGLRNLVISFCVFICGGYAYGQTIKGTVSSETGSLINASVLFKDTPDAEYPKEYTISRNGKFLKKLKKDYRILHIVVKAEGYNEQTLTLEKPTKEKTYSYRFVLTKIKEYELDEVVVIGKQARFRVKEDTVSFNVSGYKDGSERKIGEVIKKLPGVEVNEQTGEIKYKGKSIETVLLDGDNLFGYNYSLGTKNINVDMVEQIEAINNYSENPLLKGIEQGGKVSLNLKFKKDRIDFSGNLDVESGFFEGGKPALNLSSNLLGITKTYKSFATLTYNNVGINQTPFDYFGFTFNIEQLKEQNYFAKKIIPETRFSNLLEDRRANINNQFFGNYNAIFKLNSKLSIKTNLYYLQDKITTNQLFQNNFQINNELFTTTDNTFITKKPQQYRSDIEIKYNTSKTSLLEYNLRLRQENIETPASVIQNQTDVFSTILNTNDFYLKQDLLWTKKLSDKKAMQVSLFHSFNDVPQTFRIEPSLFTENSKSDSQKSKFQRTFIEGKATYLGSGKRDKYTFITGANFDYSPFLSRLFNSGNTISENNFDYTQSNFFNTGAYNFNRGKWQISPSYSIRILNQNLEHSLENQQETQNDFVFEPALKIKYILNSVSVLTANLSYNQNTNAEQYFFLNQVLINNRTTLSNLPSLELQKSQRYSLLYYNNDLYNQFQLNANISYQKSTGNFFTNQNITENTTQIQYFFLPQDNSNWNTSLQISKYISFIESTLKLTSNYSISNFRNIVNNSELRKNQSRFLSNSFFWKTAFDNPINFENTFTHQYSGSKSENQSAFINKSWQNTFKVIVKPNKKWFFIASSDYYLPNTNQPDEQFFFLDVTIKHSPNNKKWRASFTMRNITNENNFEQVQTSDFSTNIYRTNLLPRYFLVNMSYNF